MINKKLENLKVMGFAKFKKKADVELHDVIASSIKWQEGFLAEIEGISFATMLMNTKGELADVIFAKDEEAFSSMLKTFSNNPLSKEFLELLDVSTTRHFKSTILKEGFSVPEDFGCLEFGTFKTNDNSTKTSTISKIGEEIFSSYLSNHEANLGHFIGQISDDTYSEVAFGKTVGLTKRICDGYLGNEKCMELISLFDPESVDLDFWVPIA